jgi:signal transduction histidine kinase/ActR/RegA family two-component response regulator
MSAPSLAIKIWMDAGEWRWRINPALRAWSSPKGMTPAHWQGFAELLMLRTQQPLSAADQRVMLCGMPVRATYHAVRDAWLVWLTEIAMATDRDGSLFSADPAGDEASHGKGSGNASLQAAQQLLTGRLAQAVNLASVAVWRIDLATQRIDMNDFGYRLSGLKPRAGGLPLELVRAALHPDDMKAVTEAAAAAMECDGVIDVEARYRNADGSYRRVLTRRVAERDAQGRAVALAGVSIDQTARIAEREKTLALTRNIELITDAAGIGVWSIDLVSGQVEWNRQMYLMYDLPEGREAPSVSHWLDERMHVDDRSRVAKERRAALEAGVDLDTEFRIVRPDGSLRHVVCRSRRETRGGRELAHGIHVDITQRRTTESRLQLLEQRALLANQAVRLGTWERNLVTDDSLWDAQMYALRGLEANDTRSPNELRRVCVHPDDLPDMLARAGWGFVRGEGSDFDFEFRVIWPDGSVHWLNTRGLVLHDDQGQPIRALGVNWDVTQRKLAEQSLRDKLSAEQASRTKSEFLSSMSHELRTPLNAVLGFAQLLLMDTAQPLAAEQAHRVDRIRTAGQHLLALIDDVLDMAAVESGVQPLSVETVGLHQVLGDVILWMEPLAAAQEVRMHLELTPAWVKADARRVRQVVVNLLSNAIKYNQRSGEVWVSVQRAEQEAVPSWELTVRDSGRGLSATQLALVFEPFNRLGMEHEGIEGTGIGLTIVRDLVQRMGGRISVTSEPGQGSQFSVCWPLVAAPTVGPLPEDTVNAGQASVPESGDSVMALGALRPLNMLYIEDNPVNVLLLQELLALRPNVHLRTAFDGSSGLNMAQDHLPDVVLIDMQLPDFDGMEVLRRLKTNPALAAVRLIALSANAMPDDVTAALAGGFDDYWTKPIDMKKVLEKLDALSQR